MDVVSVMNYKGGVGKTTVTANLAAELGWREKHVLLLDMDPQCSLTFSFIRPEAWERDFQQSRTIKTWFDSLSTGADCDLPDLIVSPRPVQRRLDGRGSVDLIPSHLGLINVDLELASGLSGATLAQARRSYLKVHQQLAKALHEEDAFDGYDIVLIDCPPNFNIVTKNAIVASDAILVPAIPDYLSTMGIDYLMRSVEELVKNFNEFASLDGEGGRDEVAHIDPKILGVVFTMIRVYGQRPIAAQRDYIRQVRSRGDVRVFESYVRRHPSAFMDPPAVGVPVVLNGDHAGVVEELEAVTEEFWELLEEMQ